MAHEPDLKHQPESHVLVVDDDPHIRRLLTRVVEREGLTSHVAEDAEGALTAMSAVEPGVVIADVHMPGHDGLWLLERIRAEHPDAAVVMLTGDAEVELAVRCLREGASDFLTKPVRPFHLVTAIERAIERRRLLLDNRAHQERLESRGAEATRELRQAYHTISTTYQMTLEALSAALDAREDQTGNHSRRVARISILLAEALDIPPEECEHLERAALLHDIGKIGIPDHVLLKPGKLNEEEWEQMRQHPEIGFRILRSIPFLQPAAEVVLAHHEQWNGNGYPRGLRGTEIPVGARLFTVADTFDAITSDRPYRQADTAEVAFAEIVRCSGTQFDPWVVEAMQSLGISRLKQLLAPSGDGS